MRRGIEFNTHREDFERVDDLILAMNAGQEYRFDYFGNFIYLDTAASPITVAFENSAPINFTQGQKAKLPYTKLILKSLAAQTITLKYGYGDFDNSSQQVAVTTSATVQGANVNTPLDEITVGAGATALIAPANANRKAVRLAIPSSEVGELYLTDATNTKKGGVLEAGVIDYQDTEGAIYAHNYGASAVRVSVYEMERV